MKTAVVYYSYDGNCALVAEQIKAQIDADILRLVPVNEKRRSGFFAIFCGVLQVFMGKKPDLKPYSFDPEAYEIIILGTPVWAGRPTPAMHSFLSKTKISGKKLALFICHRGGKGDAMNKFKALLDNNTIVSEIDFFEPARKNPEEQKQQIKDWAKNIAGLSTK